MLLPLPALVAVTLVVLGAMIAGLAAPPARRPHPLIAWALFAAGLAGLVVAGVLFVTSRTTADSLIAAGAACLLALRARFLRESPGDDPPDGGDDPRRPPWPPRPPDEPGPPDEPWSWDEFDRARALWAGRREGAGR